MPATHAPPSSFQLDLADGGRLARETAGFLPDGAYVFEDALDLKGTLPVPVITGAAWLCELYALEGGTVWFEQGGAVVGPGTRRFGIFYPPFALARPTLAEAQGRVTGVAALSGVPADLAGAPVVFDTDFNGRPASAAQVFAIVRAGRGRQAVPLNPSPSLLSLNAKRLIDENYLVYPVLGRVAARLGVTAAHLSRQFKRDFGLTPSAYLRQLRVADAPLRLASGQPIADVAQDVGYNDLSRFYKQYRATTGRTPGACKT
jgi:AraC-like DNA-binding protein